MSSVSYPRAVATAALQACFSGTWIAARELSPARRRLTRLGAVAAVAALGYAVAPDQPEPEPELVVADKPYLVTEPPAPAAEPQVPFDKRKAIIGAAVVGLSVATLVGRHQLEKRWLARLTRNGHRHPTRGLAVRMASIEFATTLVLQVADVRRLGRR
ncbi:hypothetical protein AB0G04_08340 [Actinoplanes sp. NPDC023801]|uniref:hypothetical protein n=1 Tax=Actinoplanes sp. NPDC023801 TaxID=3154595 RepID=UPI0033F9F2B4